MPTSAAEPLRPLPARPTTVLEVFKYLTRPPQVSHKRPFLRHWKIGRYPHHVGHEALSQKPSQKKCLKSPPRLTGFETAAVGVSNFAPNARITARGKRKLALA